MTLPPRNDTMPQGGLAPDAHTGARGYTLVAAFVILAFLALGVRLWFLQVMRGDTYYKKTADNVVKEVDLPATRGEIRDRAGKPVVENRASYNVYVTPRFLTDQALARLAKDLHLSDEQTAQIKAKALAKKNLERLQQFLAAEDIGRDQMALLSSDAADLTGISVDARPHRSYPYGTLAAHVVGYMNQINGDELLTLRDQGYRNGDYIGRAGLERQWEHYLRGKDGLEHVIVDARGNLVTGLDPRQMAAFIGGSMRKEPEAGDNLFLTIDSDLQRTVEKGLARYPSAAAAVVEVKTGRVLALASNPAFDPNVLTGHLSRAEAERLQSSPFRPMIDKALREIYFPGSTFKIIAALAALQDGQIGEEEKMVCTGAWRLPGHTFKCMETHGRISLHSAIVESCNVFFYHLGERLGLDRMARLAMEFGFGAPTGIGMPGEAPGFIPTVEQYKKEGGMRFGYTLNTAIGQGSTKVTVLQLALAYAALATDGDLYLPQIVDRIETPAGQVIESFPPTLRRHINVAPEHFAFVRRALCGVVNEDKGTAFHSRDPNLPVEVCGKTGTAQVKKMRKGEGTGWDEGNDHGWFASFAPSKNPEIAVVVLVEHGGLGGHVAAPIAMEIYKDYFTRMSPRASVTAGKSGASGMLKKSRHPAHARSGPPDDGNRNTSPNSARNGGENDPAPRVPSIQ